jgi:DnaJ-class molecular chaperone
MSAPTKLCETCDGTGLVTNYDEWCGDSNCCEPPTKDCPDCHGEGFVPVEPKP